MSLLVTQTPARAEQIRRTVPAATVVLAALLMVLPLPLALGLLPNLPLLLVLVWASLQPRLMPPWLAFLLGLFVDLVVGQPLGHSGFLLAFAVVGVRIVEFRMESHSLVIDWLFAGLLVVILAMLSWQVFIFVGLSAPLPLILLQALTTILAYPLAAAFVARVQRRLVIDG